MTTFNFTNETYDSWDLTANFGIRQLSRQGLLTYEYNPLKVLRYSEDQIEEDTVVAYKNELSDLDTEKFNFDLQHPVFIEAQESYDGSVNLILNDNKNIPRMINTRFAVTGNNSYEIADRTVDSNIYDYDTFDIQTSLYKRVNTIPKLEFVGIRDNGNLKVGNYTFYFKLADGDGNETDWIAQSSIVSCHIGNIRDPFSMRGGMENENSYKQVEFKLTNLDPSYNYVSIYYVRTTSSQDQAPQTEVKKINKLFNITNAKATINITGFETTQISSEEELNAQYIVVDAVKTQTQCDNMLFFGNVKETKIDYEELTDLALRITPELTHVGIGHINQFYKEDSSEKTVDRRYEYYNVNNIYNYLGYWDDEFYRFGVVFILNNYTLSPVFNIRGINNLTTKTVFNKIPVYTTQNYRKDPNPTRNKITRNKEDFSISYKYETPYGLSEEMISTKEENSKGVVHIDYDDVENPQLGANKTNAIGLNFNIPDDVIFALKEQVKGLFFVRQRRNKTTLCQTIPIITDSISHLPAIPDSEYTYIMESMVSNTSLSLTHIFDSRVRQLEKDLSAGLTYQAAICPDYILDQAYYNQYFTGSEFTLRQSKNKLQNEFFSREGTLPHYYNIRYEDNPDINDIQEEKMYVTSIPDSTYQVKGRLGNNWFAAVAGEEADPLKVSYIGYDGSTPNAQHHGNTKYVTRGKYGPYIGLENKTSILKTQLFNIKVPNYNEDSFEDYIEIRGRSGFPFYAISQRFSIVDIENTTDTDDTIKKGEVQVLKQNDNYKITNIFGGDCFIGNFTFRMLRNFQNPEAPNNDIILDGSLWGSSYRRDEMATGEHNSKIILGDVYAVRMGHYATVKMCSNYNLSLRSTDPYVPSEVGMTGHKRTFYPYSPITTLGSYKIPESALVNAGFNITSGNQNYIECPDVPAIIHNFCTRVMYSDIAVQNSFRNGYRVFRDQHYQDYTTAHGELTSLIEKSGDIFCTFEHATGYLAAQATQLQADQKNATVFLTTANVLPDTPYFLNSEFGSQWQESVIKTPTCLYGVDTVAKRIWRVALEGGLRPQIKLKSISDFKVQRFLNENITLGEYETTPTIGIRNVKTHYNAFKGDIMFTFYDDVDTIEEKVWNLCFSEVLEKFITFYSWVPSFSENINNVFFTFDRDTSKYIAKLYSDPSIIKLESNREQPRILDYNITAQNSEIGKLEFSSLTEYPMWENYQLNADEGSQYVSIKYEIEDSPNSSLFELKDGNTLCVRNTQDDGDNPEDWGILTYIQQEKNNPELSGRLYRLPIKVTVDVDYNAADSRNSGKASRKLYTTLAIATPNYYNNIRNTSFWKHGYAGLMETKDKLKPTFWYGKQHPFEFEFIVAENQQVQKIFNTLQLIANKAKPESFHFEVVGESYTFADDKRNIFWRQEALKNIYQWNNGNISFDHNYLDITPEQRRTWYRNYYDKSTLFPLWYKRNDTLDEIYDSYQRMTSLSQDYQNLVGTEVVYDPLLGEFKLNVHTPARCMDYGEEVEIDEKTYNELKNTSNVPVIKELVKIENEGTNKEKRYYKYKKYVEYGRRLGNCHYKEDEWYLQIPPILYAEKNENWSVDVWRNNNGFSYPPLNLYYTPIQKVLPQNKMEKLELPEAFKNKYYTIKNNDYQLGKWWQFERWVEKQTRLRDKFIRIKVRYSGEDLAIIYAIKTMYTISYS